MGFRVQGALCGVQGIRSWASAAFRAGCVLASGSWRVAAGVMQSFVGVSDLAQKEQTLSSMVGLYEHAKLLKPTR